MVCRLLSVSPSSSQRVGVNDGETGETVLRRCLRKGLEQKFVVFVRTENGYVWVFKSSNHAACVVKITVGQPNGGQLEAFALDLLQ